MPVTSSYGNGDLVIAAVLCVWLANLGWAGAPAGAHDDYVAAMAMAWFGVMHCQVSCGGPPRDVRW